MSPSADWPAAVSRLGARYELSHDASQRIVALLRFVRDEAAAPTPIRDPRLGVDAHIADSLSALVLPAMREATTLADLGSGAGFPGLALACARPEATVHVVEATERKCAFLAEAIEACAIANATVACTRVESWVRRNIDVACARALAPLAVALEYAAPLLRIGGTFVAYKGRRDATEEAAAVTAARTLGLDLETVEAVEPFLGGDHRHLHVFRKVSATPPSFPRRPGMARKRPLGG